MMMILAMMKVVMMIVDKMVVEIMTSGNEDDYDLAWWSMIVMTMIVV